VGWRWKDGSSHDPYWKGPHVKKLTVICMFALVLAPVSYGFFGSGRKRRRHKARQAEANQRFQESIINSFNVDAMRGAAYDNGLRQLEQMSDLRGQTGAFSDFGVQKSEIPAFRLLSQARGQFSERRGEHTSTSLPFYVASTADDLGFALESVKISEAALKELRSSGGGAAGGFKMMKFLQGLMGKVSQRQKGLVNGMLILVSVPYFATLASAWWMGPNTAMDMTWPMAKEGIAGMIEQVLKRFGKIGMGTSLDSFMPGGGGMGGLGDLGGGMSSFGNLGGGMSLDSFGSGPLGQLNDTLGQVNESLGTSGLSLGDLGSSPGQMIGKVTGHAAGQLAEGLNVGESLGLGTVNLGPLEVDLAEQADRLIQKQIKKAGTQLGENLGQGLEFSGPLGELNDRLGSVNVALGTAGLSLGNAGQTPFQMLNASSRHVGGTLAGAAAESLGVNDLEVGSVPVGGLLQRQIERQGRKVGERALETVTGRD